MPTFAYLRVSTTDQTTEQQLREITNAGHVIEPGELADAPLRRDVHAAFATFGLMIRESEDGDVWVDVEPLTPPDTLH